MGTGPYGYDGNGAHDSPQCKELVKYDADGPADQDDDPVYIECACDRPNEYDQCDSPVYVENDCDGPLQFV